MAGETINPKTLQDLLATLDLSQKEFSSLTKISESTISEMIKGKRPMSAGAAAHQIKNPRRVCRGSLLYFKQQVRSML